MLLWPRAECLNLALAFCQLLQKCPEKRLGAGEQDAEEIKVQPFFRVSGQWSLVPGGVGGLK